MTRRCLPMRGAEPPTMKGYLNKYNNTAKRYNACWFVLKNGILSYYRHQDDEDEFFDAIESGTPPGIIVPPALSFSSPSTSTSTPPTSHLHTYRLRRRRCVSSTTSPPRPTLPTSTSVLLYLYHCRVLRTRDRD
ncbi:hypothetical protein H2248_007958 [Termitomyces sp. 'cryptogamus']|nr:hypothetical protein H2248_007958 [Termitomyces sp. 'cryptogamus']